MVQEGIASLDRGETVPAEQVFDRLQAKYRAMAEAQKQKQPNKKIARR
jgi:hypothetical protein